MTYRREAAWIVFISKGLTLHISQSKRGQLDCACVSMWITKLSVVFHDGGCPCVWRSIVGGRGQAHRQVLQRDGPRRREDEPLTVAAKPDDHPRDTHPGLNELRWARPWFRFVASDTNCVFQSESCPALNSLSLSPTPQVVSLSWATTSVLQVSKYLLIRTATSSPFGETLCWPCHGSVTFTPSQSWCVYAHSAITPVKKFSLGRFVTWQNICCPGSLPSLKERCLVLLVRIWSSASGADVSTQHPAPSPNGAVRLQLSLSSSCEKEQKSSCHIQKLVPKLKISERKHDTQLIVDPGHDSAVMSENYS